jgi:hypothetical protein
MPDRRSTAIARPIPAVSILTYLDPLRSGLRWLSRRQLAEAGHERAVFYLNQKSVAVLA